MADTVFERVTGQPADVADPVAVDLVITDETLLGGDDVPATVSGYGPIPASVARGLVSKAVSDKRSRCTLRRLYRHPRSSQLVAMESRSRFFPKGLARFIICVTRRVARLTAMRLSGTAIMPGPTTAAARPAL